MIPRLISHMGSQDGIRWGDLYLSDGSQRRYLHDRLNGTVSLRSTTRWGLHTEDLDPVHLSEAWALVEGRP